MATGDSVDILGRLQRLIPSNWFPAGASAIRDGILSAAANAFAFIYSMIAYVKLQTRISTATDGFLDLIAYDFFGNNFSRANGQSDASFRNQIIVRLFRQRNTREAIILVIQQLLGTTPVVTEPWRAPDVGAYSVASTMGYSVAGRYGSLVMPLQCFVDVTIPGGLQIAPPLVTGYGSGFGGYGVGLIEYIGAPQTNPVIAADVYAALDSVRPVTGKIWVSITNTAVTPPISISFTFDSTSITFDSSTITMDSI